MNKNFFLILNLLVICSKSFTDSLDTIARNCGTDKSSLYHNYTAIYNQFLSGFKDSPLTFLEIGVGCGGSTRLWDQYFTNPLAKLYFIDINGNCYKHFEGLSSRCTLNMVNQASADELHHWVKLVNGQFDIIIDDGSHQMEHQIISFKTLFPHLKKGGLYIIEDLHTSYWRDYGSEGDCNTPTASATSMIRFLQNLVDDINYVGAKTEYAHRSKQIPLLSNLTEYQEHIASIHFYTSLCIIEKD